MRTTINLPDGLVEAAKERARAEGRTITSLVEDGLRTVLATADDRAAAPRPLPAHGTGDGRLLVDLGDRDALWEALDGDGWR